MIKILYITFLLLFFTYSNTNAISFNSRTLTLKCNNDDLSWCEKSKITKRVSKSWNYSLYLKDKAWNKKTVYYSIVDSIKTDNSLSWTNWTRNLILKCNDSLSWCEKGKITKRVSKNGEYILSLKDKAWNITWQIFKVSKIDKSKPILSLKCNNNSYQVNKSVSCNWSIKDISWSPLSLMLNNTSKWWEVKTAISNNNVVLNYIDNWTYEVKLTWWDLAWNKASPKSIKFKIDTSNPSINTWESFSKWYNEFTLKDLKFSLKDQRASTNDNEETWLKSLIVKLNNNIILVDWFKQTTGVNTINITIPKQNIKKYILEKEKNILNFNLVDKVWNLTNISYYIKYDKTIPIIKVSNTDYSWKNNNINIKLNVSDKLSWLVSSKTKYIWDNEDNCKTWWKTFSNNDNIVLSEEWEHTLYLCTEDKAWNIKTRKFWPYKLDKTTPIIKVSNTDYSWKNNNINIKLNVSDKLSWLVSSKTKYIWDNEDNCKTWWKTFSNNDNIVLSKEWEHTLYLCTEDKAWNIKTWKFWPYKLDKTVPNIELISISDFVKAWENNFNLKFKLYDNLNWSISNASYDKYNINYSYDLIADTNTKEWIIWIVKSNVLENYVYSITDASEKWEKFKFRITAIDKAWNKWVLNKDFIVYPSDLSEQKTTFSLQDSKWTKYANNLDYYTYKLILKDKYNNLIYDKPLLDINQDNNWITWSKTLTLNEINDSWEDALIEFSSWNTNQDGEILFKVKSLVPWFFSTSFKVKLNKWNNKYENTSDIQEIFISKLMDFNSFKKPFTSKLEVSKDWIHYWIKPEVNTELSFRIKINTWTGVDIDISNWTLNISPSTVIVSKIWHLWHDWILNNIDNSFSNNDKITSFDWTIDANDNILEWTSVSTKNLEISYKIWNKIVKYFLTAWELGDSMDESILSWEDRETLWLRIIWTLQWDWKSSITWQKENFSDLSKSDLRNIIRKNAYILIKWMESWKLVNGVKYIEWDKEISTLWDLNDIETLIVKNWNVIIDENINKNKFWIIVLKDNYDINNWYNRNWNILIDKDVTYIKAALYSDWWIISSEWNSVLADNSSLRTSKLDKQLVLKWSLFTRNTIWWAVLAWWKYKLPWWKETLNFDLAMVYDLNYIRSWNIWWDWFDSNLDWNQYNKWYDDSFIIIYNSDIQNNAPKWFSK